MLLAAFVLHEARTQLRSLRFRVLCGIYLAALAVPIGFLHLNRSRLGFPVMAELYAAKLYAVAPLATAVIAFILSVDLIGREREEGSFLVASLTSMSSAGYLVRRWLSIIALILPLTALGPVGAAAASYSATGGLSIEPFLWPWLLHVCPLALCASALGAALGTIMGGTTKAAIAGYLVFGLGIGLMNDLLARQHFAVAGPSAWLAMGPFVGLLRSIFEVSMEPVTCAPYDRELAIATYTARAAPSAGICLLLFGLSVAYVRRSRPDVRPWPIKPRSSTRNLQRWLNALRQDFAPDARPSMADALSLLAFAGAGLSLIGLSLGHNQRLRARAIERHRAEVSGQPAPTSPFLVARSFRIGGELRRDGAIDVEIQGSLVNEGDGQISHVAFSLNPELQVRDLRDGGGALSHGRSWDRMVLELPRPIGPGEERTLALRLRGTPARIEFPFGERIAFATSFQTLLDHPLAIYQRDFSHSRKAKALSPRRVFLQATDLTPVIRYATWALTEPAQHEETQGRAVPPENRFPITDIDVDLRLPGELFAADACGNVAAREDGGSRLRGSCRLTLEDYAILGGAQVVVPVTGVGTVALLPAHVSLAGSYVPALESAAAMVEKAWGNLVSLERQTILEWPPEPSSEGSLELPWFWRVQTRSAGRVLLLPEIALASGRPLEVSALAAQAIASDLLTRRHVEAAEEVLFRRLLYTLALQRVSAGEDRAARGPRDCRLEDMQQPLLGGNQFEVATKLPSLLVDLQSRVGGRAVSEGVSEFLLRQGRGTLRELFSTIAGRAGTSLDRFYADYVEGGKVPILALADVAFTRAGSGFIVTGTVANKGSGEASFPVELQTETERLSTRLLVDGGGRASFRFEARSYPSGVLVDPGFGCFRFRQPLADEAVMNRELAVKPTRLIPASADVKRLRLSLQLLLQRSGALFIGADLLFVLIAIVLFVSEGDPRGLYYVIVVPFVVLGVPILSDLVALERRAGSLDLALSSPGAGHYFERRLMGFLLVMVAQGWGLLLLGRIVLETFALTPALIQIVIAAAFLASAVLFWATRLRNGSAVILATVTTLTLFSPWFFTAPFWRESDLGFWSSPSAIFSWAKPNLVMGISTVGMYLYARRRLDRPELLLG